MSKISDYAKTLLESGRDLFSFGKNETCGAECELEEKKYMLPIGFYDLLGEEAQVNHQSINILLKEFSEANYSLIKTPLVEFEENWQENKDLNDSSFKMIDPLSNKTLVIRSDITTQIARLINTKLKDAKLPLRLSYVGDVLKIQNNELHADRQLTQVGLELIGDNSFDANIEVINLVLSGLENIKLPHLLIDFCLAKFLPNLLAELGIESEELKQAIARKNLSQIREFGGDYADNLAKLVIPTSDIEELVLELSKLPISSSSKKEIKDLRKIVDLVKNNYSNLQISIDIFGDADFSYHDGVAFYIFDTNSSCTIGRGGSYHIGKIPAVGATVYINNLRKILIQKK